MRAMLIFIFTFLVLMVLTVSAMNYVILPAGRNADWIKCFSHKVALICDRADILRDLSMPTLFAGGYQLNTRPGLLLSFPEHAAGIGRVAAEWAALEQRLLSSIAFNFFEWGSKEAKTTKTMLSKIDSLIMRLTLIESLFEDKMPPQKADEWLKIIKPKIRKKAVERNNVVHAQWHACDAHPDKLISLSYGTEPMLYSVRDFHDISERICDTANLLDNFWHQVRETIYPKTIPSGLDFPKSIL